MVRSTENMRVVERANVDTAEVSRMEEEKSQSLVSGVRVSNGRHRAELSQASRGAVLKYGRSGPREPSGERSIGIQYEGIGRMMRDIDVMENYVDDI